MREERPSFDRELIHVADRYVTRCIQRNKQRHTFTNALAFKMVAPISVPGNQPINPSSVAVPNTGRRGSQSLSSSTMFSPFSPSGGTSVAAAAALGTSPPTATNMSAGFGSGFLAGAGGLGRSISNGKQIGQVAPLMSPGTTGDARGQGILRRLSLGAGAGAARVGSFCGFTCGEPS